LLGSGFHQRMILFFRIPEVSPASATSFSLLTMATLNWLDYNSSQSQSYITTDGQSASLSWCQAPISGLRPDFYYCQTVAGLLMWGALSDERTRLPFTVSAGPRQSSHSWIQVPRDSWPYFTVSDSRLHQPWGSGPRIYIRKEQGGPVIHPGTVFNYLSSLYSLGTYRTENVSSIIACPFVSGETRCSQSCSLATDVVLSPVYTDVTSQLIYMSQ
jgi:hypothetical protein